MAYPSLPESAQNELDNLNRQYLICIHMQEYEKAFQLVTSLSDRMLQWQDEYGQRFHKGLPIHNTGHVLYLQNKLEEALKYFLLAYIEDLLSTDKNKEDEADSTLAGKTLLLVYGLPQDSLGPLKETVRRLKNQGRVPLRPEEVVSEFGGSSTTETAYKRLEDKATIEDRQSPRRKFMVFQSQWEDRVFIGGSGLVINPMRDKVQGIGIYDTVVATDFDMPEGMSIYQKCMTLLHCCKFAIFDLSSQGG